MHHAEKAINSLIKNAVGGRAYDLVAPQKTATPFAIVQRVSSERVRAINGPSGIAQALIQVDVYGDDSAGVRETADAIETILDGYSGTVMCGTPSVGVKIAGISLQNEHNILDQTDEPRLFRNIA